MPVLKTLMMGSVFAALVLYLVYDFRTDKSFDGSENDTAPFLFPQLEPEDVTSLTLQSSTAAFSAYRDGEEWHLTEPKGAPADSSRIQNALSNLVRARIRNEISGKEALNSAEYGLEHPELTISLVSLGTLRKLEFGSQHRITLRRYARLDGAMKVLLVDEWLYQNWKVLKEEIRKSEPFSFEPRTVKSVEIIREGGQRYRLEKKSPDEWQLQYGTNEGNDGKQIRGDLKIIERKLAEISTFHVIKFIDGGIESLVPTLKETRSFTVVVNFDGDLKTRKFSFIEGVPVDPADTRRRVVLGKEIGTPWGYEFSRRIIVDPADAPVFFKDRHVFRHLPVVREICLNGGISGKPIWQRIETEKQPTSICVNGGAVLPISRDWSGRLGDIFQRFELLSLLPTESRSSSSIDKAIAQNDGYDIEFHLQNAGLARLRCGGQVPEESQAPKPDDQAPVFCVVDGPSAGNMEMGVLNRQDFLIIASSLQDVVQSASQ